MLICAGGFFRKTAKELLVGVGKFYKRNRRHEAEGLLYKEHQRESEHQQQTVDDYRDISVLQQLKAEGIVVKVFHQSVYHKACQRYRGGSGDYLRTLGDFPKGTDGYVSGGHLHHDVLESFWNNGTAYQHNGGMGHEGGPRVKEHSHKHRNHAYRYEIDTPRIPAYYERIDYRENSQQREQHYQRIVLTEVLLPEIMKVTHVQHYYHQHIQPLHSVVHEQLIGRPVRTGADEGIVTVYHSRLLFRNNISSVDDLLTLFHHTAVGGDNRSEVFLRLFTSLGVILYVRRKVFVDIEPLKQSPYILKHRIGHQYFIGLLRRQNIGYVYLRGFIVLHKHYLGIGR